MRSSWSSATAPPLEGGSSCPRRGDVRRASRMRRVGLTESNRRRTNPGRKEMRLEANGVRCRHGGAQYGVRQAPRPKSLLGCVAQRGFTASRAEIGMPNPEIESHADRGQGVCYHHCPEGEKLVSALGKDLQEAVEQHFENQKHRQQR